MWKKKKKRICVGSWSQEKFHNEWPKGGAFSTSPVGLAPANSLSKRFLGRFHFIMLALISATDGSGHGVTTRADVTFAPLEVLPSISFLYCIQVISILCTDAMDKIHLAWLPDRRVYFLDMCHQVFPYYKNTIISRTLALLFVWKP